MGWGAYRSRAPFLLRHLLVQWDPGASNMLGLVVKSPTYTSSIHAWAHTVFGAREVREHLGRDVGLACWTRSRSSEGEPLHTGWCGVPEPQGGPCSYHVTGHRARSIRGHLHDGDLGEDPARPEAAVRGGWAVLT